MEAFAAAARSPEPASAAAKWKRGLSVILVCIKLIKRMMYGKVGFALLRQRVLHRIYDSTACLFSSLPLSSSVVWNWKKGASTT